jgi:late competence protein required for DNA uptake (superfamily II DNA/RNA helicase)
MHFHRLKDALSYWDAHPYKLVVADDTNSKGAKSFHVLTVVEEKELCFGNLSPLAACLDRTAPKRPDGPGSGHDSLTIHYKSFYEVIHTDFVYLVFDLDMLVRQIPTSVSVNSAEYLPVYTIENCRRVLEDVARSGFENVVPLQALRLRTVSTLSNAIRAVFPAGHELPGPLISGVLDATRSSGEKPKFSLHVHTKLAILQHSTDGAALAAAVNFYCVLDLWKSVMMPDVDIATLLLFALVWPWGKMPKHLDEVAEIGFIDLSIYSKNRVMRMYGQSKFGESRPLCEVDMTNGTVVPLQFDPEVVWRRWKEKYQIKVEQPGTEIVSVLYSGIPPYLGVRPSTLRALACRERVLPGSAGTRNVAYVVLLPPLENFNDSGFDFLLERGVCIEPSRIVSTSAKQAAAANVPVPASVMKGKSDFNVLLSDSTLFNDRGDLVVVEDIAAGDILHCPKCDLSSAGDCPDFNPSMRAFSPEPYEVMLYCFGCNVLHIVRNVVDYVGFKDNAYTVDGEKYLTGECILGPLCSEPGIFSNESPNILQNRWLIAVNSPMGSGKTEAVAEITRSRLADGPFLVVTYRRALARQLAERFNASCYLDLGGSEQGMEAEKLVICTNSLTRMATGQYSRKYSLVVIDEAGFVRRHYVQGTFQNSKDRMKSYKVLQHHILDASLVIVMQDALSESDVVFYRNIGHFNVEQIRRVYMPRRPLSDVLRSTSSENLWMTALRKSVNAGHKVFVCCSMRNDAEVLYSTIISCALFKPPNCSLEEWRERVALITGTNTFPKHKIAHVDEFALRFKDFDVAITTSVLETGVSLSGHYTHVFGHFKRTPITHATQAQLASRVRNAERVFLLLQRGQELSFTAKVKQIARLLKYDLASVEEAIFNDTVADVMAEFADTYNNNDSLWKEIRLSVSVDEDSTSFNSRLCAAGFLNSDSDKEEDEDIKQLKDSVMGVRQCGNNSIRRYVLANMTEDELDKHDVLAMVEEDLVAAASASEKLKRQNFNLGKNGTSLFLCLARIAGNLHVSRSQCSEDFMVQTHATRAARHVFFYMALVDYSCAIAMDLHDASPLRETAYWTHLLSMERSNTATGRSLQISLSEVTFASRLVESLWGSIWPAPAKEFLPTTTALAGVFAVFENDRDFVFDKSNKEIPWAALGRKNPKTVLAKLRTLDGGRQMQGLSRCVREKTPLQTLSVKRDVNKLRMNASLVKPYCVNSIAVVMGAYNPSAIGLSKTSTVDWVFFKEAVDSVRRAIANFEVNKEALQHARNITKPLTNQTADSVGYYGDEHRALDKQSLEKCGFNAACTALREKLQEAAFLLKQ